MVSPGGRACQWVMRTHVRVRAPEACTGHRPVWSIDHRRSAISRASALEHPPQGGSDRGRAWRPVIPGGGLQPLRIGYRGIFLLGISLRALRAGGPAHDAHSALYAGRQGATPPAILRTESESEGPFRQWRRGRIRDPRTSIQCRREPLHRSPPRIPHKREQRLLPTSVWRYIDRHLLHEWSVALRL